MNAADPVIVVHGLWVHGVVMSLLARRLARCDFVTHTYSYPSMRLTLSENAARLAQYCERLGVPRINIVAHSMGGLISLKMLEGRHRVTCGRLLLLGTPYSGSFAAARLARFPGGSRLLGRGIAEWRASSRPGIAAVVEVGIIAGTRGFGLGSLIAPDLPRPNDGVVTVAETAIPGVTQRIDLKVTHTEMLVSRAVVRQCCAFLRDGRFIEPAP